MKVFAKKEMIFNEKPTKSCHASTVLPLENGEVIAAWFGGTREGSDDVDIWVSVRSGGIWSKPQRVSQADDIPHWNPVLFKRKDGTICLFFKVGKKIPEWKTYYSLSEDKGRTWSKPAPLVPDDDGDGRGPVKNKCLRLSDGRILAPASSEMNLVWNAFVDMSFDDGRTWEKQMFIPKTYYNGDRVHVIQPTLWEYEPGKVSMLMRSGSGRAYRSDSEDYGKTWCKAYRTSVLNNNSGLDLVRLDSGILVLVSNPVEENWGTRAPLTIMASDDNGNTWEEIYVLEKYNDEDDEFSYPAIEAIENTAFITYTWQREKIAFWKIEVTE